MSEIPLPVNVPVNITIAETIPPEFDADAALEAAQAFRDAVLDNPQQAVFALTVGRHYMRDVQDSFVEINKDYHDIIKQAAGLLALTDNGRYLEFDPDSEDAIAADQDQSDMARTVQMGRGSPAMLADMRRASAGHSLLLFARRAHAFQMETNELDSIPAVPNPDAEPVTEQPNQPNKNPAA
jgi:hypothetical protein